MFVVAGITGKTGAIVARTLLAAGRPVRGLVRSGEPALPPQDGLEVRVLPTLADANALAAALRGATGAYLLLPTDLRSEAFLADSRATTQAIAQAVRRSAVPHVVLLSSIGAHLPAGTGPVRALHAAERQLADTGTRLTCLRAALFLENWAPLLAAARQGSLPCWVPPALPCPTVAAADIGRTAAQALLDGPAAAGVVELAGPRELSADAVAGILAGLLGRDVAARQVPPEAVPAALRGAGVSHDLAVLYAELHAAVADGTLCWQGRGVRSLRGTTTALQVLQALL